MLGAVMGRANGLLALVALALGYIVCSLARKEGGILKLAGYVIGASIIIISSVIIIGKLLLTANFCFMGGKSPMPISTIPGK